MSSPLRVAMIIQGYHPCVGGAERQLASIIPLLQERGVVVQVYTRRYAGLKAYEEVSGVPVYRLPVPGPKAMAALSFVLAVQPMLQKFRPQIVHAHELLSPTTAAITAKRLMGVPVVVKVLRGGLLGDLAKLRKKLLGGRRISWIKRHVDRFIAVSREIEAELREISVREDRLAFIPSGVDTVRFYPLNREEKDKLRSTLGLPHVPIVIFTGRMEVEKRVDRLMRIWPKVLAVHPQALLVLLGSGGQLETWKRMAGERVVFMGQVEEVTPFLQASDVFVLPSSTEGLSNALLEAMSSGLASVVTDVGGGRDAVVHGESGWLVPPDDMDTFQEALIKLLADPSLRSKIGRSGRERVVRSFSLSYMVDKLCALYDELMQEQGHRV
ncbi:MAG: glycosyltransferase family 4 protein [Chloroflexota bacterium]